MICSQDQKIILPHFIHKITKSFIKLLDLMSISLRISSVSPQSIEIHQVYKTKSMKIFFADLHGLLHAVYRAVRMISLCDSLATENIVDLSNTDHIKTCILQCIERCSSCGLQCIIMAVAGSFKLTLFLSHIRPCNNSSNSPLVFHGQFSGNLTAAIQICKIKRLLISADLHYGIRRRVNDHGSCIDLFLTKLFNDFRTAGTLVSDHTLTASFLQLLDQFLWKSCLRKSNKRLFCIDPHHFPVSGHGILAIAGFRDPHITPHRFLHAFHPAAFMQVQHSQLLKIGNIQSSHLIQDMSKCIHTFVTKFLRIRHCPDSK